MRFQISEMIAGGDPDIILELLEKQLRQISKEIVCSGQSIKAYDIRTSSISIVQKSTVICSVRTNGGSCLLLSDVNCRPSFAFWFFFGLGLPTALGWLIPIAFYFSQRDSVRATIEDIVQRTKAEREFNDSSVVDDIEACRDDAERGVVEAQVVLADAYYEGNGVPQDFAESIRWYRKAAEQGNVLAQYNLGDAYYSGKGVPLDFAEGVRWFRRAAEQGDAQAQNNLAEAYYTGTGVPQDNAEAARWFRKASEQGDEKSTYNFDLMRKRGQT